MPSKKSTSATPFCKVCFKAISAPNWRSLFGDQIPLCGSCFREMDSHFHRWNLVWEGHKVPVQSLYLYNEKIRSMLFQFKGCADIELAPLFLGNQAPILRMMYRGYTLAPAPSFSSKNEARGFNHVELMFAPLRLPLIHPLVKVDDVKQADLHYDERQRIGEHLRYDESVLIVGKKILFVDDLMTTGATAKACCELLLAHHPKKLQILVMGYTPEKAAKEADKLQPN